MIRKDVIIAVLVTFCLTLTLFSPIRVGGYDPWADINDDGRVDMKDIATVAKEFGTAGDSTKNVNVTNWQPEYELLDLGTYNISGNFHNFYVPHPTGGVFCGGYSRLSVSYIIVDWSAGNYNLTIALVGLEWDIYSSTTYEYANLSTTLRMSEGGPDAVLTGTALFETKGPYFALIFKTETDAGNWSDIWAVIAVHAYLRND